MVERPPPPATSALLAEGTANARAGRMASVLRIVLAFGLGLGAAALTATTVTAAQRSSANRVLAGRNTIRVLGAANTPVTAASCDSLNTAAPVRHAGGLSAAGSARLTNGTEAPRFTVTAGFAAFLRDKPIDGTATVAVGSELARMAGLRSGTTVTLDGGTPRSVVVLPENLRTRDWSSALLAIEAPTGLVDECWVEFDAAPTDAHDRLLVLIDGPRPLVTGPLEASTVPPTPAETTATTLNPTRTGTAVALPLLLVTVAVWWARRSDWALYAILGFPSPKTTLIAATEWSLTCGLPMIAGAAWGALLTLRPDGTPTGGSDVAQTTAVAILGASLALAWLRFFTARMRTRRLLAGI